MIIDEKKYFDLALHFRECQDQSGYFEADSLTTLRVWVDYLERVERIAPRQWETITRVPLAWVVKWQNKYPFFTEEDWTHEHLPQEQRLCLSHGPYFQVGDRVQLHDNVAGYFTRVFGATYTVVEVFDHHADQVEAGGLPEYRASEDASIGWTVSQCLFHTRRCIGKKLRCLCGSFRDIRNMMCELSRMPTHSDKR